MNDRYVVIEFDDQGFPWAAHGPFSDINLTKRVMEQLRANELNIIGPIIMLLMPVVQ